jgi:hypothetical protein
VYGGKQGKARWWYTFWAMRRCNIRGPFEKFVDSPYDTESKLCEGAVTVSFSKYLPSQAMNFLQRSNHSSKTCCRPFGGSFKRIVEQAVLTSWSLRGSSFTFVSPSLKRFHHLKTAARTLHRLQRPCGWIVGFLIHFFQAERRLKSRNADAPPF